MEETWDDEETSKPFEQVCLELEDINISKSLFFYSNQQHKN
jgi:hypothetical protein